MINSLEKNCLYLCSCKWRVIMTAIVFLCGNNSFHPNVECLLSIIAPISEANWLSAHVSNACYMKWFVSKILGLFYMHTRQTKVW